MVASRRERVDRSRELAPPQVDPLEGRRPSGRATGSDQQTRIVQVDVSLIASLQGLVPRRAVTACRAGLAADTP